MSRVLPQSRGASDSMVDGIVQCPYAKAALLLVQLGENLRPVAWPVACQGLAATATTIAAEDIPAGNQQAWQTNVGRNI